jgi:hypothetical protein
VTTIWLRLYAIVEGQTEQAFANQTLIPHLSNFEIELKPKLVVTNRKLGARGGGLNFETISSDMQRLMSQQRGQDVRFTTMIDLYKLPRHFPGYEKSKTIHNPVRKVEFLEGEWAKQVNDRRFVPFIQLYEFETLLFCDLSALEQRIAGASSGVDSLRIEVGDTEPEAINDGEQTAPSKRIIRHVPAYKFSKVRVGAPAASAIGLSALRGKCPHFNAWIHRLENVRAQ